MINAGVSHLVVQLNQFLKQAYGRTEDFVVMSGLFDAGGSPASHVKNKLVMFLVNLEKDSVPYCHQGRGEPGAMRAVVNSAPIYLNLYVMLAANFSSVNYGEALKFISSAITFFQRHSVFDHQSTPGLDARLEKLVLDIENLKIQELSNIWTLFGGKYLPSVLYKVRMVVLESDDIVEMPPTVRALSPVVHR